MRAVLHIGAPKSGTSAIQRWLATAGADLAAAGVLYPDAGRVLPLRTEERHVGFRFAFADPDRPPDGLMPRHKLTGPAALRDHARRFVEAFDAEVRRAAPEVVAISDEALFIFADDGTIARARTFLRDRFDRVDVVVTLRHPVDYVRGVYSQRIKTGGLTGIDFARDHVFRHGIYLHRLARWKAAFGDDLAVHVLTGDARALMLRHLPPLPLPEVEGPPVNPSLTAFGAAVMLELNRRYQGRDRPRGIKTAFEGTMTGAPFRLRPGTVAAVWRKFDAEREALLDGYIAAGPDADAVRTLWRPAPATEPVPLPDPEEVRQVCDLLVHVTDEAAAREARLARGLKARLKEIAALRGEADAAGGRAERSGGGLLRRFLSRA